MNLAERIAALPKSHDEPLWKGPCADGPLGGITQSMIARFLSCRERFRVKYVLGLQAADQWSHRTGFGNMWHVCEEALAKIGTLPDYQTASELVRSSIRSFFVKDLGDYCRKLCDKYPFSRDDINKWYHVCCVQFPEYIKYWSTHPDVQNRTPLMQEQVFDVPYRLPSGRTVRLRGKFDSVHITGNDVVLMENKTKSDIDEASITRQVKFDLQTLTYLIALRDGDYRIPVEVNGKPWNQSVKGVLYNVIRRPLSGGKGSIRPHAAKSTKTKITPAETDDEFYERLRVDYIAAEPEYWFFRVRAEVTPKDIQVFREQCLDPILEQICSWYDEVTGKEPYKVSRQYLDLSTEMEPYQPPINFRMPFGTYNVLQEGGFTEYDAYLDNGSMAGLRRSEILFTELQ